MKFGELKSIGHNIADSLASGVGLMIGVYEMDIFGEAARSSEGYILVDFIHGTFSGAEPSASLSKAISLYTQALDELCRKHGTKANAFGELSALLSGCEWWPICCYGRGSKWRPLDRRIFWHSRPTHSSAR
ncbi:hypothetical protein CQ062_19645 [Ochrobactrum sp. MYb68]|nr:hypothetical protein CQ062_19645 [Ochrobactrum sp. MYb68]